MCCLCVLGDCEKLGFGAWSSCSLLHSWSSGGVTASAHTSWLGGRAALPPAFWSGCLASSWQTSVISSYLMAPLLLTCPMTVWVEQLWLSCWDFGQISWQKVLLNTLGSTRENRYEHRKLLLVQVYFLWTKCRMVVVGVLWSCTDSSAWCMMCRADFGVFGVF